MQYDIRLSIHYRYHKPANGGRHILRMMPMDIPALQRVIVASQDIQPKPVELHQRTDFFGNSFFESGIEGSHSDLIFSVKARVDRGAPPPPAGPATALADLAAEIAALNSVAPQAPHHFLHASPRIQLDRSMTNYASRIARPHRDVSQVAEAITKALHRDIEYDPEATTVDTPAREAFQERKGVCQDIAHIMIAALRGIGIPAGYVSGFLRTEPPKGTPRLEGADAMHAWVRVWCGTQAGWIEYDPTNGLVVGTDHIVIARGRDFSDVSPVKGLTRTSGGQDSKQKVTVLPLT